MRRTAWLLLLLAAPGARAGEIPDAVVVLEVFVELLPGHVPEATPPRFVLLEDGQVFVGGTSHLASGQLEKDEVKALEKRLSQVRRLPGLGSQVSLGPGTKRFRLVVRKGRPLEIVATGDPATAPVSLRPIASLLDELAAFSHPSLRPYAPASYALAVWPGSLLGGCRRWGFTVPLADALSSPRTVPALAAEGWPTGATPASVCADDKTYVVTLRPLLPGEKP